MIPAASGGVIKSAAPKPLLLSTSSLLIGGGAISGAVSVELENQSISKELGKGGTTLSGGFAPSSENQEVSNPFLEEGLKSVSSFFSSLSTQISSLYSTVAQHSSTAVNGLRKQSFSLDTAGTIYTEVKSGLNELSLSGTEAKEILSELGIQKSELQKMVLKIGKHSEILNNLYQEIKKNKSDWIGAMNGISEKAGGYREVLKYVFSESETLSTQLTKLKDKGSSISDKMSTIVKKLNEKKSELNEILKDLDTTKLTGEQGVLSQLKSNLSENIVALAEQSNNIDSGITTLKTQKEKFKKLVGESGKAISTGLSKKQEFSTMLGLDKSSEAESKGIQFNDVVTKLKDIDDSSFAKLESIQTKLMENKGASKILIKKAGSGGDGFIKLVNKGNKYKTVFELYPNSSGTQSQSVGK